MKNIQIASYCLTASAFILAGLLVVSLRGHLGNPADAAMVISRDTFTLMTAQTRNGEEALWVLDNRAARMLIYRLELRGANNGRLALAANIDMNDPKLFGGGGGGDEEANRGRRGR